MRATCYVTCRQVIDLKKLKCHQYQNFEGSFVIRIDNNNSNKNTRDIYSKNKGSKQHLHAYRTINPKNICNISQMALNNICIMKHTYFTLDSQCVGHDESIWDNHSDSLLWFSEHSINQSLSTTGYVQFLLQTFLFARVWAGNVFE